MLSFKSSNLDHSKKNITCQEKKERIIKTPSFFIESGGRISEILWNFNG